MTGAQKGILMLTCPLVEDAATLSPRQFYGFRRRLAGKELSTSDTGELTVSHLTELGLPVLTARKIIGLLDREELLSHYLRLGAVHGIVPLTRICGAYPDSLEQKLGDAAPPALFCRGDVSLLQTPCVALVGSRKLHEPGRLFAETVGWLAAEEGYTLVSGGAPGADTAAQEACLRHGGKVIVFTPERLTDVTPQDGVLYCSEGGYDLPFSAQRALGRNRLIHALAEKTFVAQCDGERGGTWRGSLENLKNGYSELFVFQDGSRGAQALLRSGAEELTELFTIGGLKPEQLSF